MLWRRASPIGDVHADLELEPRSCVLEAPVRSCSLQVQRNQRPGQRGFRKGLRGLPNHLTTPGNDDVSLYAGILSARQESKISCALHLPDPESPEPSRRLPLSRPPSLRGCDSYTTGGRDLHHGLKNRTSHFERPGVKHGTF